MRKLRISLCLNSIKCKKRWNAKSHKTNQNHFQNIMTFFHYNASTPYNLFSSASRIFRTTRNFALRDGELFLISSSEGSSGLWVSTSAQGVPPHTHTGTSGGHTHCFPRLRK